MFFNVVIKEAYEYTGLVFHFEENFEEALKFAEKILRISDYSVEILQIYNENKDEKREE